MMKRFIFAFGRSLRSGLVALGALAFLGTAIAIGANYALTQGAGTTFASVVISGVNYAGYMLCDFTVGETHCASVDNNNQLEVSQATAANLNATVTGSVTANAGTNLNTSTLALETGGNLAAIAAEWFAQGSTTSGQKGTLIQGAVTSSAPSYTNAQTSPLSLDTAGNLRVNVVAGGGSGGTSSSFAATFPSTGTAIGVKNGANMVNLVADSSNNLLVGAASGAFVAGSLANGASVAQGSTTDSPCTLPASGTACSQVAVEKAIANAVNSSVPAGTAHIGTVGVAPYPDGATPYTATATGTTAATTATLAGAASVTTYLCGFSIRANATAAATGNATVTGTITATLNFTQWTAPLASGLGITEEVFVPCIPASGTNQSIAVVSAAPGSGGTVSVTAWGYKL